MKVFISHSSQDNWIARQLSQQLEAVGVVTFLDEKDLRTGDSIDDSIQQHLGECDELLMLLSPAALASSWVLVEIGGAKALHLRLIPILLHVGANDLPAPLAKGLARDLNDVDAYLAEAAERAKTGANARGAAGARKGTQGRARTRKEPAPSPTRSAAAGKAGKATAKAKAASRRRRTFKVGDIVKIPEQPQEPFITDRTQSVNWTPDMTPHSGKTATVIRTDDDRTVVLDVMPQKWWAMDWLELASGRRNTGQGAR